MPYKYVVVCSTYLNGEMSATRFGIAVVEETDGNTLAFKTVSDLSTDFDSVQKLVNTCNQLQLDYETMDDVLADFLCSV